MSGQYHVLPDTGAGGRWNFTREQLARLSSEIRPGSKVGGPYGENETYQIDIPSGEGWTHEVVYQANPDGFSFRTGDEIDVTGGLVFQIIQRLAPDVPAMWVADFDGEVYPLRIAGRTEGDFVRELLSLLPRGRCPKSGGAGRSTC